MTVKRHFSCDLVANVIPFDRHFRSVHNNFFKLVHRDFYALLNIDQQKAIFFF